MRGLSASLQGPLNGCPTLQVRHTKRNTLMKSQKQLRRSIKILYDHERLTLTENNCRAIQDSPTVYPTVWTRFSCFSHAIAWTSLALSAVGIVWSQENWPQFFFVASITRSAKLEIHQLVLCSIWDQMICYWASRLLKRSLRVVLLFLGNQLRDIVN